MVTSMKHVLRTSLRKFAKTKGRDKVIPFRKEKVKFVVAEKSHSFYCQCYNFPLDQSQKLEDVNRYFL